MIYFTLPLYIPKRPLFRTNLFDFFLINPLLPIVSIIRRDDVWEDDIRCGVME